MKNRKINLTPIEFPQFSDSFINFFIDKDVSKVNDFIKEKGYTHVVTGSGITICDPGKDPIVWLQYKRLDLAVHEMTHAVFHLLKNIGIESLDTKEIQEVFAYLVEYSVKQAMK